MTYSCCLGMTEAYRLGSATSAAVTVQGSGGTQACTAGEKGVVLMSFSSSSTCSQPKLGYMRHWAPGTSGEKASC